MVSTPSLKSSRFLKGLGYGLLFLFVFVATLWTTFPYGLVRDRIEGELAARGLDVRLGTLGAGSFPGVRAERILIDRFRGAPVGLELGPTTVHLPLGTLFSGAPLVEIESESFGGLIRASGPTRGEGELKVFWRDLDFSRLAASLPELELALQGDASGQLRMEVPPPTNGKVTGELTAQFRSLTFGPGTIAGLTAPQVRLGSGLLSLEADKGRVQVRDSQLTGGDMDLGLEANLMLGASLQRSTVDGTLTIRPTPEAQQKLGLIFSLIAEQRDADGNYVARFRGSLKSPRLRNR